jgi:hypothetical protein
VAADLSPLLTLTALTTLVLRRANARDLSPLGGMRHLTWLVSAAWVVDIVTVTTTLCEPRLIAPVAWLVPSQDLHACPATNLDPLSALTALEHADLASSKAPSLGFAAHMPRLLQLLAPSCIAPSLQPLGSCRRLLLLDISTNRQATDLQQVLGSCLSLRRLYASGFLRAACQRAQRAQQAAASAPGGSGGGGALAGAPVQLCVAFDTGPERLLSLQQLLVKCGLGAAVEGAREAPKPVRGR